MSNAKQMSLSKESIYNKNQGRKKTQKKIYGTRDLG